MSDTPMQMGGNMRAAWAGPALTGQCPVCPSGMHGSEYPFPADLEDGARAVHAPSHSTQEYEFELGRLDTFMVEAQIAFDGLRQDMAARRARLLSWAQTDGVTTDPDVAPSVVPDEVGRGGTR